MYLSVRRKVILALIGTVAFLIGCATNIELKRAKDYDAKAPNNWKAIEKAESDQAFELPSGSVASITSSCHRNADAPLDVLTKQLLMGSRNINVSRRERMDLGKVRGLWSELTATFESKLFHFVIFVLPSKDCVFDFSLVSPKVISKSDKDEFLEFLRSFRHGNG